MMRLMQVLLTSSDNPYVTKLGGKHIHLILLEQGLKETGLKVTTLYYDQKSPKELAKKSMVTLFAKKRRYKLKLKWMIDYLKKRIPKHEFDIIHSHDVLSMLAVGETPWKKVLTLHGYFARENIEFIKNRKDQEALYPYLLQLEQQGLKKADYIITVDQRLKEYVASEFAYPRNRISVIHNAVDINRFRPVLEVEQQKLKETLGFGANQFIILVPRRLVEKNGVIYAVHAMKHIKNENVKMIIAGEGPEKETIAKEANGDRRVVFAGTIPHDKISPYYMMADAILIPSVTTHEIQEASSLAMLEGMACGKVVICSNIGGMKEIIQNMNNGILTKEKDPQSIAEAIETIIDNPSLRPRIGAEAAEYAFQNHSFLVHARKVAQIYDGVLRGDGNA
jgi:glycosyltransferase involved in cell wall biosynthesis